MILRCRLPRLVGRPTSVQCLLPSSVRAWTSQQSISRTRTFASKAEKEPVSAQLGKESVIDGEEDVSFLEQYKRSYKAPQQSLFINNGRRRIFDPTVNLKELGKEVTIHGHLGARKDINSKFYFVPLVGPGKKWEIQLVSKIESKADTEKNHTHHSIKKLRQNSAVAITGELRWNQNVTSEIKSSAMRQGNAFLRHLEISITEAVCLNEFPKDIIVSSDVKFPPEKRHLQIMNDLQLYNALKRRSNVGLAIRYHLSQWQEVETPVLFKSTPEGAREFLVPTRKPGFAYALPQSPQQYKQILMASGIGRYFQFARCFRDEDLRADRQPEFTQLDLEMAFADGETVMRTVEDLIRSIKVPNAASEERYFPDAEATFPRMTYQYAMDRYGVDKPDTRNEHLIHRIDAIIPANLSGMLSDLRRPIIEIVRLPISESPSTTWDFVKEFMSSPEGKDFQKNPDGAPGIFVYDSRKPIQGLNAFGFEGAESLVELYEDQKSELQDGDLLIVQARPNAPQSGGSTALGRLRLAIRKAASDEKLMGPLPKEHQFLWVVDFPMFTPNDGIDPGQGGSSGFKATHHPFTAPRTPHDIDLLSTDPLAARADHYDLVVNGVELGGGSRRIHNAEVQKYIMKEVLKMSEERMADFSHLFEALRAGCPPHAGFALGFDRLIAVLSWTDSVRDVIAFPKNNKGEDPFVGSPSLTDANQQATYHLKEVDNPALRQRFEEHGF